MLPLAPARSSSGVRVSAVDATRRVQRLRAASGPAALVTTSARAAPRATALGARIPTLTRRGARLAAMSVKAGQLAAAPPLDAAPKEAVRAAMNACDRRREHNLLKPCWYLFATVRAEPCLRAHAHDVQAATTTGLSVAIIGAGVAGLQAARALQKRGVAVTVFESSPDIGGVWRSNYDGYAAQGARIASACCAARRRRACQRRHVRGHARRTMHHADMHAVGRLQRSALRLV
jgi:NADPH-dependent 2,4-dienoyl-CoA reductase/sulfur reductase-like enzyme